MVDYISYKVSSSSLVTILEDLGLFLARFIGILSVLILLFAVVWYSCKILSIRTIKSEIVEGIITDFKRGKTETITRLRGKYPVSETIINGNVVVVTVNGKDIDVNTDSFKYSSMIGDIIKIKTNRIFKKGAWVVVSQELID